jgi:predicted enzyme related to lactoylglutathione lyase
MASTRDAYLPGVPCWIDLRQPDPEAARAFYGGLFGWSFSDEPYSIAALDGRAVAAIAPGEGPQWNMYVAVESVEAAAEKVAAAGGRSAGDTEDVEVGRLAGFQDSLGARFLVWEARGFPGAQLVNGPGTWVFSGFETGDRAGAARFYGDVFGWTLDDLQPGPFFRLAGYGDYLEAGDWGGFEDVVASFANGNGHAQWWTTFGVEHCDRAVERAIELGATVLGGPSDAPYVRTADVRDPQGAVITLAQYVGE